MSQPMKAKPGVDPLADYRSTKWPNRTEGARDPGIELPPLDITDADRERSYPQNSGWDTSLFCRERQLLAALNENAELRTLLNTTVMIAKEWKRRYRLELSAKPVEGAGWIGVAIERPEGYEDVCDELVAEDAMRGSTGFRWGLLPALPSREEK